MVLALWRRKVTCTAPASGMASGISTGKLGPLCWEMTLRGHNLGGEDTRDFGGKFKVFSVNISQNKSFLLNFESTYHSFTLTFPTPNFLTEGRSQPLFVGVGPADSI